MYNYVRVEDWDCEGCIQPFFFTVHSITLTLAELVYNIIKFIGVSIVGQQCVNLVLVDVHSGWTF